MRLRALIVFAGLVAAACASSGQGDGAADESAVQLTVINEYVGTVTAYALWASGRVRLGDVGQNRTRVFMTPARSDVVSLGLEMVGAPPGATTPGPTLFQGAGNAPDPSAPFVGVGPVNVVPGDALEFRLSAGRILTVRRLEPGL